MDPRRRPISFLAMPLPPQQHEEQNQVQHSSNARDKSASAVASSATAASASYNHDQRPYTHGSKNSRPRPMISEEEDDQDRGHPLVLHVDDQVRRQHQQQQQQSYLPPHHRMTTMMTIGGDFITGGRAGRAADSNNNSSSNSLTGRDSNSSRNQNQQNQHHHHVLQTHDGITDDMLANNEENDDDKDNNNMSMMYDSSFTIPHNSLEDTSGLFSVDISSVHPNDTSYVNNNTSGSSNSNNNNNNSNNVHGNYGNDISYYSTQHTMNLPSSSSTSTKNHHRAINPIHTTQVPPPPPRPVAANCWSSTYDYRDHHYQYHHYDRRHHHPNNGVPYDEVSVVKNGAGNNGSKPVSLSARGWSGESQLEQGQQHRYRSSSSQQNRQHPHPKNKTNKKKKSNKSKKHPPLSPSSSSYTSGASSSNKRPRFGSFGDGGNGFTTRLDDAVESFVTNLFGCVGNVVGNDNFGVVAGGNYCGGGGGGHDIATATTGTAVAGNANHQRPGRSTRSSSNMNPPTAPMMMNCIGNSTSVNILAAATACGATDGGTTCTMSTASNDTDDRSNVTGTDHGGTDTYHAATTATANGSGPFTFGKRNRTRSMGSNVSKSIQSFRPSSSLPSNHTKKSSRSARPSALVSATKSVDEASRGHVQSNGGDPRSDNNDNNSSHNDSTSNNDTLKSSYTTQFLSDQQRQSSSCNKSRSTTATATVTTSIGSFFSSIVPGLTGSGYMNVTSNSSGSRSWNGSQSGNGSANNYNNATKNHGGQYLPTDADMSRSCPPPPPPPPPTGPSMHQYNHPQHYSSQDETSDSNHNHRHQQQLEEQFSKLYADFNPPQPSYASSSSSIQARSTASPAVVMMTTPRQGSTPTESVALHRPPEIRRLTLEDAAQEQQQQQQQSLQHSFDNSTTSTGVSVDGPLNTSSNGIVPAVTPPSSHLVDRGDSNTMMAHASSSSSPANISFQSTGSTGGGIDTASQVSYRSDCSWMLPLPVRRSKSLDFLFTGGPSIRRQKKKEMYRRRQLQQQQQQQQQSNGNVGSSRQGGGHRYPNGHIGGRQDHPASINTSSQYPKTLYANSSTLPNHHVKATMGGRYHNHQQQHHHHHDHVQSSSAAVAASIQNGADDNNMMMNVTYMTM